MPERKVGQRKSEELTHPIIIEVNRSAKHTFSKANQQSIKLIQGVGVAGDAHTGKRVKHRYLVNQNPKKPNLRQVHLIHSELFDELYTKGLLNAVLDRDEENNIIRKPGVMGIVLAGGTICPQDYIVVDLPTEPHYQLEYVW